MQSRIISIIDMTKLKAKLIVSDFDGTLITSDQRILSEVRRAISQYVEDGGIFAVCTGRILASILPQVRQLGLKGLVAACQSSVIADIQTGQFIRHGGLTSKQTSEICAAIESLNQTVHAYSDEVFYSDMPEDNEYLKMYEKIIGVKAEHPDLPLSQFVLREGVSCQKVASLCFSQDRDMIYKFLADKFKDKYDVTCSADVLVEVSPIGDTKGEGVKFLADYYGIDIADTVAIGDNLNDMSMIEVAGVGVAVGNAVKELKAKADFISSSNDDGAVAQVIKMFGYCND